MNLPAWLLAPLDRGPGRSGARIVSTSVTPIRWSAFGWPATFFAAWLGIFAAPGFAADPEAHERARAGFWRAVAAAYSVDRGLVAVEPEVPGLPFDALAIGELVALRATIGGSGELVQGFGSLSGGNPAFARFRHIGSDGIATLLAAMAVLDPERARPIAEIVPRIAWAYPEFGIPVEVPGQPWSLVHTTTGATIEWTTRNSSRTGILNFWRVALHVDSDHGADIARVGIPNPFLLKGTVNRGW